ncbi:MAG: ATP-binding protein [Fimbriimonadales bacterium]|jgi:hypothetical protein|nr:ATP-binding protein [Fimbriimonadales bacterium]GBC89561.1 hypothetical protein HRbin14_00287 [bacterium HR14]GIV13678.1 MAG: hypothetical protein KatS3mg021_1960 [Fimbriimonadales bacterium]CUU02210.1 hypothetical protein GBSOP10_10161 [Armatimonadetes bacterium GBS]
MFFERWLTERVVSLMSAFPVVMLQGARQVGKTTLAQQLITRGYLKHYYSFDDPATLEAAASDPAGFIETLPPGSVLDEAQRVPEVLLPLKARIDREREVGQFVLTGSANPIARFRMGEPLVGRMGAVTLYPLSQGEQVGKCERWLEQALQGQILHVEAEQDNLWERVVKGGYPNAVLAPAPQARTEWLNGYLDTLLTREVRELAEVQQVSELVLLTRLLAANSAQLLNQASLSRECGIPQTTLRRYVSLLEAMFLLTRVPAWYTNISQRLLKTPKILLNDTGITCALLDVDENRLLQDPLLRGRMLESFVGMELLKQIEFTAQRVRLSHFRTASGHEVDFVLEKASGEVVGVEVKASSRLDADDFRGLRFLQSVVRERWQVGVVFYTGTKTLPFGERLWAQPVNALWETA